jgi:hypothetical protein
MKRERPYHEIVCNEYPLYEGSSTQEAMKVWDEAVKDQLDVQWYINGIRYRTSGKPSRVAV